MASSVRVKVSLYDHPFSPRSSGSAAAALSARAPHPPEQRSSLASAGSRSSHAGRPAAAGAPATPRRAGAGSSTPVAGARPGADAIPAPVGAEASVGSEASGARVGARPVPVASDSSSSSEGMGRNAANDEPIPWGYRSGDSASTRALGRTFKYGDPEDLGASRIGFLMPKHMPPPEPQKKLDAAAVDAGLESVVPLTLPDAVTRRAAEVDEKLQDAVLALSSRPPLASAAVKHLDAVIEANPHCQPALKLRAGAHCMLSHYAQALEDADAALYMAPMDEVSWLWKATAHDLMNEYSEAVEAYTSGLQYEPTNARLQKGYVAAVKRAERAGNKRDTLRFRGSKTLRDSEYAFTPSQVSETKMQSTAKLSTFSQVAGAVIHQEEEGISYEPADPVRFFLVL